MCPSYARNRRGSSHQPPSSHWLALFAARGILLRFVLPFGHFAAVCHNLTRFFSTILTCCFCRLRVCLCCRCVGQLFVERASSVTGIRTCDLSYNPRALPPEELIDRLMFCDRNFGWTIVSSVCGFIVHPWPLINGCCKVMSLCSMTLLCRSKGLAVARQLWSGARLQLAFEVRLITPMYLLHPEHMHSIEHV